MKNANISRLIANTLVFLSVWYFLANWDNFKAGLTGRPEIQLKETPVILKP